MRIVFAFASRSRPVKFFNTLDTIFRLCKTNVFVSCALDLDDITMYNEEVFERLKQYGDKIRVSWALSKNKVHAINRSAENLPPCDIIICQSDDMEWTYEGFDEQIIGDMLINAPDTDLFLHYFDGRQKNTSTLNIVGRKYFQRQNYIYFPGYVSVYPDNEETEKAKLRGKYKFFDKIMYIHRHPIHGAGVAWDEQYKASEHPINYAKDGALFRSRQAINFDL